MTTTKIMKWLKSLCHRHRWCRRTIFQDNLCKLVLHCQTTVDFNGAWDVGNASDATWSSKMCTALVRSPTHHQYQAFLHTRCPSCHPPTNSNKWLKGNVTMWIMKMTKTVSTASTVWGTWCNCDSRLDWAFPSFRGHNEEQWLLSLKHTSAGFQDISAYLRIKHYKHCLGTSRLQIQIKLIVGTFPKTIETFLLHHTFKFLRLMSM